MYTPQKSGRGLTRRLRWFFIVAASGDNCYVSLTLPVTFEFVGYLVRAQKRAIVLLSGLSKSPAD